MIRLAFTLTRAGGWPRMLLVAACTALVSALLLVVIAILRLPAKPDELLFNLVDEPGLRVGTVLAAVLLTVPPLLLLDQAVRLGTASRERRLAAVRLAGATPSEVRRLGALEVGIPALAGGVLGLGVYGVLREVLGGTPKDGRTSPDVVALVPTTVTPTWWQTALVVGAVGLAGTVVGFWVSSRVVVTPLGVSRRQPQRPPRPWGLLLLGTSAVLWRMVFWSNDSPLLGGDLGIVLIVGMAVVGMVSLVPWVAYRLGRVVEARARSVAALLAARRLVTDPRPAGRAAAAVGGIALVSGGTTALTADFLANHRQGARGFDSFYLISTSLIVVALFAALVVVIGSLAVHSAESLLDRKRSISSLTALGVPLDEVVRSQTWEAGLAAIPVSVVGAGLGFFMLGGFFQLSRLDTGGHILVLGNLLLTSVLVWVAVVLATATTRPWAARATSPANLRTE